MCMDGDGWELKVEGGRRKKEKKGRGEGREEEEKKADLPVRALNVLGINHSAPLPMPLQNRE